MDLMDRAEQTNGDTHAFGDHSPCIGVCILDDTTGLCTGCARTGAEIAAWGTATAATKHAVWSALPERLQTLGARKHLSPLSPDGILDWLADIAASPATVAVTTGPADARRTAAFGDGVTATRDGAWLVVRDDATQVSIKHHDKMRMFVFGPANAPTAYVLTLPKGRMRDLPHGDFAALEARKTIRGPELAVLDLPNWAAIVAVITTVAAA